MSNLPANISNLVGALESAQQSTPPVASGDFLYLKMTKIGEWVYGAEETEVAEDSVFVVEPSSYAQGYVAWDDGELIDEQMAAAGQPPIVVADLPALPAGVRWDSQVAFALKGIEGGDKGVQLLYKVSSRGGKTAIAELLAEIIARGKAGNADLCPVVILERSSYKHKKYGKIFTPVLRIDEWLDVEDAAENAEPEPEAKEDEEPATEDKPKRSRRGRAAEPEAKEAEEPEPAKRTRRSRRNT